VTRLVWVAVVDDDASVRRSFQRLLRAHGFDVQTFASAEEFLARVGDEPAPACLIVDMRMPGKTGLDLIDTLNTVGVTLPVILITGHGDETMAIQARRAGAVEFLTKPVESDILLHAIARAVGSPRDGR
jgi:FixJ family two-component response regulator